MRTLFALINRYKVFLIFLFLEILGFWLVVNHNYYQNAIFFNSANSYVGTLLKVSNNISSYFQLNTVNLELAKENRLLRVELTRIKQKKNQLFEVKVNDPSFINQYDYILAKVINNSTHRANNYITIDKGKKDGIEPGMAVISPLGIVGKVRKSNGRFTTLVSLLHANMTVSAQVKKNSELGTIKWDGKSPNFAKMLDVPINVKIAIGDTIVTSGYNATFPPKITIGIIKKIKPNPEQTFYDIDVMLTTNFNSLSYVYVVKNILKVEQDSLEMETFEEIEE